MRAISKGREPPSLTEHRATSHSDYDNYADKDGLRAALVRDQRGLCCYCMARIEIASDLMKIEHWQCQDNHPDHQLEYNNMLAACLGGKGQPGSMQHCDTRKGNQDLKFNPADPAHRIEQRIGFGLDGTITSTDVDFNAQLNDVLGLNLPVLKNRRKAVVDGLIYWLRDYQSRHHRGPDVATLQRMRSQKIPFAGKLEPFVHVAVWWLDQRLPRGAI